MPGQSVERLAALSDAVYTDRDLWHILIALSPRLLIFLMRVMTLGIFWVGPQTQLNRFARAHK